MPVNTNDGVLIAKAMKDFLNNWAGKPVDIQLEDLGKRVPSMMVQQLSSAQKVREYINGSYIGAWNFAIYVRVQGNDTASRLDAVKILEDLSAWLTEKNPHGDYYRLPNLGDNRNATKIEMTSTPSIAARYDDGQEDYQAIFRLEFKVRR